MDVRGPVTAAVIEAVFAIAWFQWGRSGDGAPVWLQRTSMIGSALAIGVAVAAFSALARLRRDPTAGGGGEGWMSGRYVLVVAIEAVLVVGGAVVLARTGAAGYVVVWVAAVVGAHFLPLARIIGAPQLTVLGVAVFLAAAGGLLLGLLGDVAPVLFTAPLTGLALLVGSVTTMIALRGRLTSG